MRKPYTVSNLMDVWECDLLDVKSVAKHNDMHRYILSVIEVFFEISASVPREDKERSVSHFRVSIPISR